MDDIKKSKENVIVRYKKIREKRPRPLDGDSDAISLKTWRGFRELNTESKYTWEMLKILYNEI